MKSEVKGRRDQDALDLLRDQDRRMERLLAEWDELARDGDHPDDEVVQRAWRRGTVGKLIHQHAAIRLAAQGDVVRALRHAGQDRMANVLAKHVVEVRDVIDRLDEHSRGMSALDLRYSDDFDEAVADLRRLWRSEIRVESEFSLDRVRRGPGPGACPTPQRPPCGEARPAPSGPAPPLVSPDCTVRAHPLALRPPAQLSDRREHRVLRRRPGGAVRCRQVARQPPLNRASSLVGPDRLTPSIARREARSS